MTFRMLTACALALAIAAPAFAADGKVTVSLCAPVPAKTKIVALGAVFACEGETCIAWGAPEAAVSTFACETLAKEAGPVAAIEGRGRELSAADVARCNLLAQADAAAH
ncbi:MAG: CC_3452 family protein [Parcubacteria group bacterium]